MLIRPVSYISIRCHGGDGGDAVVVDGDGGDGGGDGMRG